MYKAIGDLSFKHIKLSPIALLIISISVGMVAALLDTSLGFIFVGINVFLVLIILAVMKHGVETSIVLALGTCVSLGYTYPVAIGSLPPTQITFLVAFACLISLLLISGRCMVNGRTVQGVPLLAQFIAYILALVLSVMTAFVPALGFTYLGHALMHALAFYVGLFCLPGRLNQRVFTTVLIVGGVISSLLGWIQRFWPDIFMVVYGSWNPVAAITEFEDQIIIWGRSTSIWGNPSAFSTFMNITWPLAVGRALISSRRNKKIVFGLAIAALYSGIVISNVRADYVGLLAGATFIAIRFRGRILSMRYFVLGGILILVPLLFIEGTGIHSQSLFGRLSFENQWDVVNAYGRIIMIQEHYRQFVQFPLTGVGLRNSEFMTDQEQDTVLEKGVSPHNHYTGILAEAGIVGFLALIWLLASSFRLKTNAPLQSYAIEDQIMSIAFITSNVILLVTSLVQNPFIAWQFGLLFWILRGNAVGLRLQSSNTTGHRGGEP